MDLLCGIQSAIVCNTMQKLKYLFAVQYNNGNTYTQNEQDVSVKDPGRSCFFDVDVPNVHLFFLKNPEGAYCVDLHTGYFKANESGWFKIHKEEGLTNFRLIYFRRVTTLFDQADGNELSKSIEFHIGWQANTPDGKNVQYTLALS